MKRYRRETIWHFINPVCLAVGIIGFLLYFEVSYFEIGITGLGAWGVSGAMGLNIEKKDSD
jgi:hypothetical protein